MLPVGKQAPNPSLKASMKNLSAKMQLPSDIGLLERELPMSFRTKSRGLASSLAPETFIMPTGPNKPSLFRTPRLRLKLEWHRLKSRMIGLGG